MTIDWRAVAHTGGSPCLAVVWDQERTLQMLGYTLLFVGAILFLALVVYWVDRWRKRPVDPGLSAGDQLTHFRELYERGAITPEEFARIKGLLGDKLRQELNVPAAPPVEIQLDEPPASDAIQAREPNRGPYPQTPPPPSPPADGSAS
jgi:hypothetical protein